MFELMYKVIDKVGKTWAAVIFASAIVGPFIVFIAAAPIIDAILGPAGVLMFVLALTFVLLVGAIRLLID